MIPLKDQEFLRQRFAQELVNTVRIDFFTQRETGLIVPGREECPTCKPTRQMLEELAALSDKIDLRLYYLSDQAPEAAQFGVDKVPAIVIRAKSGRWFTYYGIPSGHEFPTFIDAITEASRGANGLDAEARKELRRLKKDVHLQVFVTPT